jgi:hypothetical protein
MSETAVGLPRSTETELTKKTIEVRLEHATAVCFAMEQTGVPVVQRAVLNNHSTEVLSGATLHLSLEPGLADGTFYAIPVLRPGEQHSSGVIDLPLRAGRLRNVLEAERAKLAWSLRRGEHVLADGSSDVEVLAYNEWPGLRAPPSLLASFSTPNDPTISSLPQHVARVLEAATGKSAIDGYQAKSPARAFAQVQALYDCLQALGLSYSGVPASFETTGQKIRTADVLARDRVGNCLDLTLFVTACLEQMDLAPLIVLFKGHAVPAVWLLDDRFPEGVVHDAARLRTAISLGYLIAFDATVMVDAGKPTLAQSRQAAEVLLADDAQLECAVDVRVARRGGFRPISLRDPSNPRAPNVIAAGPVAEPRVSKVPAEVAPPVSGRVRGQDPIRDRFRQWADQLLDLSLWNKLLNFRLDAKAALPLDIPDIARFEDYLANDRSFDVMPAPPRDRRDERDPTLEKKRLDPEERRLQLVNDLNRQTVHSTLAADEMLTRAVHLDRTARADLEEGGANTLYAAIGLLRWYETDEKDSARIAPLLLVPVQLEYQRSTRRIRIKRIHEESLPNVTLVEKLRRDRAVDLSGLVNLEADESGVDVPKMLQSVRDAIRHLPLWEVEERACLGLFTFSKFLMWRDLSANADKLLESNVVRFLASKGTLPLPPAPAATRPPAPGEPPEALPLVVDSDSSQTSAVLSALAGRSFVLQGPPGTGKSQTITNLIAATLHAGKTVLFVSEKMAALEVVQRRLAQTGLADFCLELHSHKANKRAVVQSLAKTLARKRKATPTPWSERSSALGGMRNELDAYVEALHRLRPLGVSFFDATSRLSALGSAPKFKLLVPAVGELSAGGLSSYLELAGRLATSAAQVEPVSKHPWRSSAHRQWSAALEEQISEGIQRAAGALRDLDTAATLLGRSLETDLHGASMASLEAVAASVLAVTRGRVPRECLDDARWTDLSERAERWRVSAAAAEGTRAKLVARWNESLFDLDLATLEALFKKWAYAFFLFALFFLWGARRRMQEVARGALVSNGQIADDLSKARDLLSAEPAVDAQRQALSKDLEGSWSGTDRSELERVLAAARDVRASVQRLGGLQRLPAGAIALMNASTSDDVRASVRSHAEAVMTSVGSSRASVAAALQLLQLPGSEVPPDGPDYGATMAALLERYAAALPQLRRWCLYATVADEARRRVLAPIVEAHAAEQVKAADIEAAVERSILEVWMVATRDGDPILRDFDGPLRHRLIDRYRDADRAHIELGQKRVAEVLDACVPAVSEQTSDRSELGILKRETEKKTRHFPIRKLLQSLPNVLPRLKPCLLMSPLSVAQFLPADGKRFDLVVFDEASQICTYDAVGAIARGEQVVVVGDSKQLPPTSFFKRGTSDDEAQDENDFDELESVLDEAKASGLPEQMLTWHYRSRHEALIGFSNEHYYGSRLNVFPAAQSRVDDLGVHWHHVANGRYERGRTRTNPIEAKRVVDYLIARLEVTEPGQRTFGIVTFSQAQQELIADLLDKARGERPKVEAHFSDKLVEPVFVKNLENVQGDERDEIYFSICYGPDGTGGPVAMNFGPLNRQGGERRLNVAVTRARRVLRVFSTLTPDHIDLRRTSATGPAHLKSFLTYVASSSVSQEAANGVPRVYASRFDEEVAGALVQRGYVVDTAIGCGAYRLDLAVRHPAKPGVYALAIEGDGESYASAATARDRDRLRHDVLAGSKGLGWRLHRVWSTDWWFERDREVRRLEDAIATALVAAEVEPEPAAVVDTHHQASPEPSDNAEPSAPAPASSQRQVESVAVPNSPAIPYERLVLGVRSDNPEVLFDTTYRRDIAEAIDAVTRREGPIHVDELCRRVGGAYGVARLSQRMRTRIVDVASHAPVTVRGEFVWPNGMTDFPHIRGPGADGYVRPAEALPPEEMANAGHWVLRENVSMPQDDLVREMARLFGYERAKSTVAQAMAEGIRCLEARGGCLIQGETIVYREVAPRTRRNTPLVPASIPGPAPPHAPATPSLGALPAGLHPLAQVLSQSKAFLTASREGADRRRLVIRAVDFLARRDGHCAPLHALATALDTQPVRASGLVSVLSEVLNVDGYVVLRNDPANKQVILDVAKMQALFGFDARP